MRCYLILQYPSLLIVRSEVDYKVARNAFIMHSSPNMETRTLELLSINPTEYQVFVMLSIDRIVYVKLNLMARWGIHQFNEVDYNC